MNAVVSQINVPLASAICIQTLCSNVETAKVERKKKDIIQQGIVKIQYTRSLKEESIQTRMECNAVVAIDRMTVWVCESVCI